MSHVIINEASEINTKITVDETNKIYRTQVPSDNSDYILADTRYKEVTIKYNLRNERKEDTPN